MVSAVAERYAHTGIDFAGVVLAAAFSSLPTMLSGYAIAGYLPILRPLAAFPELLTRVLGFVVDDWDSAARLTRLVRAVKARNGRLNLSLVHARNDWDIPYHEDDKLFAAAVGGFLAESQVTDAENFASQKEEKTLRLGDDAFVSSWSHGGIEIRQELFPYGGESGVIHVVTGKAKALGLTTTRAQ